MTTATVDVPAEPGWYVHPDAPGLVRWFDGTVWTSNFRPAESDEEPADHTAMSPLSETSKVLRSRGGRRRSTHYRLPAVDMSDEEFDLFQAGCPPMSLQVHDAPAGWYPDPVYAWRVRWFDGHQWTFHTRTVSQDSTVRVGRPGRMPRWATSALDELSSGSTPRRSALRRSGSVAGTFMLLVATLAVLAAVVFGWQLWGSGWVQGRDQAALASELAATDGDRFTSAPDVAVSDPAVSTSDRLDGLDEQVDPDAQAAGLGPSALDAPTDVAGLLGGDEDATVSSGQTSTSSDGTAATSSGTPRKVMPDLAPWPPAGWTVPTKRFSAVLPRKDAVAFGRIRVPAANVDEVVVTGTGAESLKKGPGVWRAGAVPGNPGNATIAGHRTTFGAPFMNLHKLGYGDKIYVDVPGQPQAVYEVRGRAVVRPNDVAITAPTRGVRLTLVACHPLHSVKYRLVVQAEMVSGAWLDQTVNRSNWRLLRSS